MDADLLQAQAWGEWVGQRAIPVFVVILVGMLVAAAVAFVAFHRYGGRMVKDRPRPVVLAVYLLLGAGVLSASAALFAEMMEAMNADEELGLFDVRLSETLSRELPASILNVVSAATHLGDPITLTLVVVTVALLLMFRRRFALAMGWIAACAGGAVLNRLLKEIFRRARPVHDHGFAIADGFSFPSGHTSGAVVVYGMLAYLGVLLLPPRWHLPGVLVAVALAVSMGCSRVMLQVHWASDVVAGFAVGLAWLTVCVAAIEAARRYRST